MTRLTLRMAVYGPFFFVFFLSQFAQAAPLGRSYQLAFPFACSDLFEIDSPSPVPDSANLEYREPNAKYYALGAGTGGGKVYLVEKQNFQVAQKQFRGAAQRLNDKKAYGILHDALKNYVGASVVEVMGEKGEFTLLLSYTRGTVLRDVLDRQLLKYAQLPDRQLQLEEAYLDLLDYLAGYFHEHYNVPRATRDELRRKQALSFSLDPALLNWTDDERLAFASWHRHYPDGLFIWIKPSNIVVDARTLSLTIIDPE